jgi:iron-sulfur cluster repair protein YtfE (RIC family)
MAHACGCRHDSPRVSAGSLAPVRPEETVGEIVQRDPGALEIMKGMGINHCCGAGLTLSEAAASVGMSVGTVLAALNERRKAPA